MIYGKDTCPKLMKTEQKKNQYNKCYFFPHISGNVSLS